MVICEKTLEYFCKFKGSSKTLISTTLISANNLNFSQLTLEFRIFPLIGDNFNNFRIIREVNREENLENVCDFKGLKKFSVNTKYHTQS